MTDNRVLEFKPKEKPSYQDTLDEILDSGAKELSAVMEMLRDPCMGPDVGDFFADPEENPMIAMDMDYLD